MKDILKKTAFSFLILLFVFTINGCGANIFDTEDDIKLGEQLRDEIMSPNSEYKVLEKSAHEAEYTYLENIKNEILKGGKVENEDVFPWEIYIIKDDNVQNAFCAPGGFIFIYTGLIKFVDSEDQLAGVLAHEIAHADKRHSTEQLTKIYGFQLLLNLTVGEKSSTISDIVQSLIMLNYSRSDEKEADEYSVIYLCGSKYEADGSKGFFTKMSEEGLDVNIPEFISTHPDPGNRVEALEAKRKELNCDKKESDSTDFAQFQSLF